MKYHKQLSLYDPTTGTRGSCYPTILACILDLDLYEVPNFHLFFLGEQENINAKRVFTKLYLDNRRWDDADQYQRDNHERYWSLLQNHWHNTLVWWLAIQGYTETIIPNHEYDKWLLENIDRPYIVSGISARGIGHVVVYMNGKMIHDPHPSGEGLVTLHEHQPYSFLEKIV